MRTLAGLHRAVTVSFDRWGIPTIEAGSRGDAAYALGYVTARDRLFQIDWMRRATAGRLAELVGLAALDGDTYQRTLGFTRVASAVVARLPGDQREVLVAYVRGVNAYLQFTRILPLEFLLLRHRPRLWTMEDSVLVYLYLIQQLTWHSEADERMMTVMEAVLPPAVADFLTPLYDEYCVTLLGGNRTTPIVSQIPVEGLSALAREHLPAGERTGSSLTMAHPSPWGSNGWVVGRTKTADGRAILSSDLHLPLGMPSFWYRVSIMYDECEISGLVLPGVPVVVSGCNRHVAWGFTNTIADSLDLVSLELNPNNPEEYRSPEGWRPFGVYRERVNVRRGEPRDITVRQTIWGPVLSRPLMGQPVAIHSIATDPEAIDLGLLHMNQVGSMAEALDVVHRMGGPPLNMMLADDRGGIAWTLGGKVPLRLGFDGWTSKSWADGCGWNGYLPPNSLPAVIDPPEGMLVTANNLTFGPGYPLNIGRNFSSGYRAYRAKQVLQSKQVFDERDLFNLQMDTTSDYYRFYQSLVMELLTAEVLAVHPILQEVRESVVAWNGRADIDCRGLALLVRFREEIIEAVLGSYLRRCSAADPGFRYTYNIDGAIRVLLATRIPSMVPFPDRYASWDSFIIDILERCASGLKRKYGVKTMMDLAWGRVNLASIQHPLTKRLPFLHRWLDMPSDALAGCRFCLRFSRPTFGATSRMVVSPGHPADGYLHIPGGQSGHPLSPHYRDQHEYWKQGIGLPFLPSVVASRIVLKLPPDYRTGLSG